MTNHPDPHNRFGEMFIIMTRNRWRITVINLITFALICVGIIIAMTMHTEVASEWKEILMLLLGAFIGNYNKVGEFWFQNQENDRLIVQKMDEEDGAAAPANTSYVESTSKPS